ncbi:carbonic anhydrase 2 [Anabrus simplex]|uniref:carbonic anhydrase 2 n=1 Tax=Anabrus simplex TaxID=316456 RepID=UPI0035A3B12C
MNFYMSFLLSAACCLVNGHHDFGYDGSMGPSNWPQEYSNCAGKYQSPIDIEEHLVRHVRLPALKFQGFDATPVSSTLTNNGHTVMLQLKTVEEACISGGPLLGRYVFSQLHFHWGSNNSIGSESTINNHSFPLELHMVFYKDQYGNFDEALKHSDGLTVIGLFYELYGPGNSVYNEIVEMLPQVTAPQTNTKLEKQITLGSLLPEDRLLYFTYNGSLTTPPCSEVVTWIEFKQPILLSEPQVAAFRKLRTDSGLMTHNFRPVQPLSGRLVLFNMAEAYSSADLKHYSVTVLLMSLLVHTVFKR